MQGILPLSQALLLQTQGHAAQMHPWFLTSGCSPAGRDSVLFDGCDWQQQSKFNKANYSPTKQTQVEYIAD
jgi:hypothetical protein